MSPSVMTNSGAVIPVDIPDPSSIMDEPEGPQIDGPLAVRFDSIVIEEWRESVTAGDDLRVTEPVENSTFVLQEEPERTLAPSEVYRMTVADGRSFEEQWEAYRTSQAKAALAFDDEDEADK